MTKSPDYEKGFEDGLRDGHGTAIETALPALRLALQRLEVCDLGGDEKEARDSVTKAIATLEAFSG